MTNKEKFLERVIIALLEAKFNKEITELSTEVGKEELIKDLLFFTAETRYGITYGGYVGSVGQVVVNEIDDFILREPIYLV